MKLKLTESKLRKIIKEEQSQLRINVRNITKVAKEIIHEEGEISYEELSNHIFQNYFPDNEQHEDYFEDIIDYVLENKLDKYYNQERHSFKKIN